MPRFKPRSRAANGRGDRHWDHNTIRSIYGFRKHFCACTSIHINMCKLCTYTVVNGRRFNKNIHAKHFLQVSMSLAETCCKFDCPSDFRLFHIFLICCKFRICILQIYCEFRFQLKTCIFFKKKSLSSLKKFEKIQTLLSCKQKSGWIFSVWKNHTESIQYEKTILNRFIH